MHPDVRMLRTPSWKDAARILVIRIFTIFTPTKSTDLIGVLVPDRRTGQTGIPIIVVHIYGRLMTDLRELVHRAYADLRVLYRLFTKWPRPGS